MALIKLRKQDRWERPPFPRRHTSGGVSFGILLMVVGALAGVWGLLAYMRGYPDPQDTALLIFSGPAFVLGVWTYSVALILQEIRRAAFEAARRAGEVEQV